jgi:hypothetical protein
MSKMISFGGGVNSVAMTILLVNEGWKGEIVFSDTGCEWPDTYCFMDYFESEWLRPRGFEIVRLDARQKSGTCNGRSLIEYCEWKRLIPIIAMRWCTDYYKLRPLRRWCKGVDVEATLLGISADESHRAGDAIRPLVDRGIDRKGCVDIIAAEGLPIPRKSGCYICPFQRNAQWRELWERYSDLFERAMNLEENAPRTRSDRFGRGHACLDPKGKITLRMRKLSYESQMILPEIDMDALLAYKPCVCGL